MTPPRPPTPGTFAPTTASTSLHRANASASDAHSTTSSLAACATPRERRSVYIPGQPGPSSGSHAHAASPPDAFICVIFSRSWASVSGALPGRIEPQFPNFARSIRNAALYSSILQAPLRNPG